MRMWVAINANEKGGGKVKEPLMTRRREKN
jgi:hypothetical protein